MNQHIGGIERRAFPRPPEEGADQANRELARRAERLATAMREFEELSLAVAHDFRVPMAAIEQAARTLDEGERALDRETAVVVRAIRNNIVAMRGMTGNLLELCRLSGQPLDLDWVDTEVLAREAWVSVANTQRIQFSVGKLPGVRGHRGMLKLVWTILLSQAVARSAGQERPRIELTGGCGGQHVIYGVRDNGGELDLGVPGKLGFVFEQIQRQSTRPGIGVGLAIVQRIVTRHRGTVWAEARRHEGALFQFSLPAEPTTD